MNQTARCVQILTQIASRFNGRTHAYLLPRLTMPDHSNYPHPVGRLLFMVVLASASGGCRQLLNLGDPLDGDGGLIDTPIGSFCYGTGLLRVCLSEEPT